MSFSLISDCLTCCPVAAPWHFHLFSLFPSSPSSHLPSSSVCGLFIPWRVKSTHYCSAELFRDNREHEFTNILSVSSSATAPLHQRSQKNGWKTVKCNKTTFLLPDWFYPTFSAAIGILVISDAACKTNTVRLVVLRFGQRNWIFSPKWLRNVKVSLFMLIEFKFKFYYILHFFSILKASCHLS